MKSAMIAWTLPLGWACFNFGRVFVTRANPGEAYTVRLCARISSQVRHRLQDAPARTAGIIETCFRKATEIPRGLFARLGGLASKADMFTDTLCPLDA